MSSLSDQSVWHHFTANQQRPAARWEIQLHVLQPLGAILEFIGETLHMNRWGLGIDSGLSHVGAINARLREEKGILARSECVNRVVR